MLRPFLTANWRYLAILNYRIAPELLRDRIPAGTELDFDRGETFISIVGFLFLDTRLLGLPIPLHRDFEEVNLRFYVRRKSADTWRRGVAFVREIVPKRAVAILARMFYGEPYLALPMKHEIEHHDGKVKVEYRWRRGNKWEMLALSASGEPLPVIVGTHEDFILDHYWGVTGAGDRAFEYRVEHPRWRIWPATDYAFRADTAALYGDEFTDALAASPVSAFIAEGSDVRVHLREPV